MLKAQGQFHGAPVAAASSRKPRNLFAYRFPGPPDFPLLTDAGPDLDALADTMVEQSPTDQETAGLPPVFTYFGQFIDHDVTARTDRETIVSTIATDPLDRNPRSLVDANLENGRIGSLGLDSVYGEAPVSDPIQTKILMAIRDGAFMRLGSNVAVGERPPLPSDTAGDLPRFGQLLDDGALDLTDAELAALAPEGMSPAEFLPIFRKRAALGDPRNDENLIVAQFHLAMLRFHNAVAASLSGGSPAQRFAEARRQVTWTYQWLVANEFLPCICDADVVDEVMRDDAQAYQKFRGKLIDLGLVPADAFPIPLEFSAAAFRYGHSMVRHEYDFNRNFGRPGREAPRAALSDLFRFTGNGADQLGGFDKLPHNRIIEWDRFVSDQPDHPDRLARPIDTRIAAPLFKLDEQLAGLRVLARRNLRRGYNLNLASAQDLRAAYAAEGVSLPAVDAAQLGLGGEDDPLFKRFARSTPLWFYVLREAEILGKGAHLGPLGSRIVAETLIGVLFADSGSYVHRAGSGADGRWAPRDAPSVAGEPVESVAALLRAAGVLN